MNASRVSGLLVACLGLLLYVVIIPAQTETTDFGWVKPDTLPRLLSLVLTVAGAVVAWRGPATEPLQWQPVARALGYLALLVLGVYLVGQFGFLWVAPALVLGMMLFIGERRLGWLATGTIVLPLTITLVVQQLLGRALP